MKLKKSTILVCCVIIAALGITLTGCGNSSSDKDAGNSSMNVESSTDTNTESSTDINDENRYLGTWKATVMESDEGEVYDYEELSSIQLFSEGADTAWLDYSTKYYYNQLDDEWR